MSDHIFLPFPGLGLLALTPQQIVEAAEAGRELRSQILKPTPCVADPPARQLLSAEQLEKLTTVPASWWMSQARERRIPFRKIGRRVRFTLEDVLSCEALKRREIQTVPTNSRKS